MRKFLTGLLAACAAVALPVAAQEKINLSIATGGTGGVYYPLGGGMANVFSKHISGMQATAEVTGGSVDNMRLIGTGKSYIALTQADAAKVLGVTQPKVSALRHYKLAGFSVERLMNLLTALDQDVEIVIRQKPRSRKAGRISVVAA